MKAFPLFVILLIIVLSLVILRFHFQSISHVYEQSHRNTHFSQPHLEDKTKQKTVQKDGTVISLQTIRVPKTYPKRATYRMMYWRARVLKLRPILQLRLVLGPTPCM
ncbi:hypothetical protein JOD43_001288 [Pullulanibacillus pueri]|nr:hypothetical protein [Pullulanibacillus pueri]